LKPTGFDCPEDLEGVTFSEATSGGVTKLYCWDSDYDSIYTTTPTPNTGDIVILSTDSSSVIKAQQVESVTEEGIVFNDTTYIRSSPDIELV
jgi:hypothetical protein